MTKMIIILTLISIIIIIIIIIIITTTTFIIKFCIRDVTMNATFQFVPNGRGQ